MVEDILQVVVDILDLVVGLQADLEVVQSAFVAELEPCKDAMVVQDLGLDLLHPTAACAASACKHTSSTT